MIIRWIGQSGYVIQTKHTEIMIDPYLSDAVKRVANRERLVKPPIKPSEITADAIICTHNHLDHLDTDAIAEMDNNIHFITTKEGKEQLNALEKEYVSTLTMGESISVGDVKIKAVFANHTVEAFGVLLEAEGYCLYFSGDTLFDEQLFEVAKYNPDIAFICINGKLGNMNVTEALTTAKAIGAKINVPNHYGMFLSNTEDPTLFISNIDNGCILEFNKEYDIRDILN